MKAAVATVGVMAAIAFAGCGGDDSGSTTSSEPDLTAAAATPAESTDTIEIADFKYMPETVTVSAGTEVTWTNSDDAAHTASADDDSFDTGDLDQGDSKRVTLDEPGTYSYFCRFHPFMKGTVEVR